MTAAITVGTKATTCGMAGRGMNGLTGVVVCYNESLGRYTLELSSGEMLSLRPGNLYSDDMPVSKSLPTADLPTASPSPPASKSGNPSLPTFGIKIWLASAALLALALLYSSRSSAQATKPAYSPLGAFKDKEDARALRFGPQAPGYDAESCSAACGQSHKYFALQLNGFCSCDNDILSVAQYGRDECGPLGGPLCNYVYQRPSTDPLDPHPPYGWAFWRYPHWRLRYWWDAYEPYHYGGPWYWGGYWGWGVASSLVFLAVFAVIVWQLGGGAEGSKKRAYKKGWSLSNLWLRIEQMNIWELFMYASLLERAVAILRRNFH